MSEPGPWGDDRLLLDPSDAAFVHMLASTPMLAACLDETGTRCTTLVPVRWNPDGAPGREVLAWAWEAELLPHAHLIAGMELSTVESPDAPQVVYASRHDPVPVVHGSPVLCQLHAYLGSRRTAPPPVTDYSVTDFFDDRGLLDP